MSWKPVSRIAIAVFNSPTPVSERHLSLQVGDMVCVKEECEGWFRGHHYQQPTHWGIFPSCLVELKVHTIQKVGDKDYLIPADDEVILEAAYLLREWREKLHQFYLMGNTAKYQVLLGQMEYILSSRRHIIKSNVTLDVLQSMNTKLTAKLDQVNDSLDLPVSPRDDSGKLLNCNITGMQKLFRVHNDRRKELDNRVSQTGALNKKHMDSCSHVHHLFLHIDKIDHEPPEDCEIFFFLYSSEGACQVSERFMLHVAGASIKGKKPTNVTQDKRTALFTDLGSKDIETTGMYLVCQLIRKGKMLLDDRRNVAQNPYRRPYACGVLEVSSLLKDECADKVMEEDLKKAFFNMPLYLCATNHENDFSSFHTIIIKKTSGRPGQKPGCAISLTINLFHGDLCEMKKSYPSVFGSPFVTVHKLGFPDIILPGDVRNDIYVTLESGVFEKGVKRSERNVEVAIEVIDGESKSIPRAIILGAGGTPCSEYESFIFYHNNTPRWSETFKLSIPFEKLPDAHLRICFRHVAKAEAKDKAEKTFAFAFMKLMKDDGSILHDSVHDLYVYKSDHKRCMDPKNYLLYASCDSDVVANRSSQTIASGMNLHISGGAITLSRSFKESIVISTLTCSTKLTQKIELLMLLKWRQRERDLSVVLTNMLHISGEEVVKFLQDTLDCLFDILNTSQETFGEKIFEVLVTIFGLMQDDKYQHFTTVLDIYISNHFSAMLAHRFLIWCFEKHVRLYGHVPQHHPMLCKDLKSIRYLFKFMIQSNILYKSTNKVCDPTFMEELKQVFATLSLLMGYQEHKVTDVHVVQSILLNNLPDVLPDVASVLTEDTLAQLISTFLDSIRNTHSTLLHDKLVFMLRVLNGPVELLRSKNSNRCLVQTYASHLISYLDHNMAKFEYSPEVRSNQECMSCLGKMLEMLADTEMGATDEDIALLVPLILSLLRLSMKIPRSNPLYSMIMVSLIGLLDLMKDSHYTTFFDSLKSTFGSALKDFILDFMLFLTNIIKYPLFNNNWVVMYLMQARVLAKVLANISKALLQSFRSSHSFNPLIWDEFFLVSTMFVTEPYLQLEIFSNYRRNLYLQQFGDVRLSVGKLIVIMWHKLDDLKGQFIPDLINPFLKLSLLKQNELRAVSLPLVFDMVKCEQHVNGNFKRVETEVFDKMDALLFSGQGDVEYMEMFSAILTSLCTESASLKDNGIPFVETVTRLIALLLDYRNVPTDDANKGRRTGCMLNLLQFYKDIDKEELYVKNIYKLAELHQAAQCFTEAGFTLLLHAKGLEWNTDEELAAVDKYPLQSSRERKEQLYMDALHLFDQAKMWECGIPLCKELGRLYETEFFDYTKLVAILQMQADFFRKIVDIHQLRVAPDYFMVGYYGKGFPLFLRNKKFVHRGHPFEKLGAFIKSLTDEYTSAEVLKTTEPPEIEKQISNSMYLQVRTVQPIAKKHEEFEGKSVPNKIAEYYLTNEVQEFRYDRPFHKGKKNKECEFASLWVDRTTFTTVQSFPGVINWFEVSESKALELDPLSIALETLESKNQEIQLQVAVYSSNKTLSIHPLSMLLNGVIDAAVQGGVKNYDLIFFNPTYIQDHPDDEMRVKRLRRLIEEQTVILDKGLTIHGQRIDKQLQGLQTKLEKCFEDFQRIVFPEKRKPKSASKRVTRSATIARPLPPTPLDGTTKPFSSGISTLPKAIGLGSLSSPSVNMRRATGIPMTSKRIGTYEDTNLAGVQSQSVTLRARKSSSPTPVSRMSREQREGSPQVPIPYQGMKHLSVSSSMGDASENWHLSGSHDNSSSSSLNQMSDSDMYESVSDFLKEPSSLPVPPPSTTHVPPPSSTPVPPPSSTPVPPPSSTPVPPPSTSPVPPPSTSSVPPPSSTTPIPQPSSTPGSQRGSRVGDIDSEKNNSLYFSSFNAPSYPAPIPPKKSREKNNVMEAKPEGEKGLCVSDDDDDDDGYEPVKLMGGQVELLSYSDEVERAQLPLLSSPSPWSSLTGDSSQSSPIHSADFLKSLSSVSDNASRPGSGLLSSSPQNKTGLNEGATKYIASVRSGHAMMPPEPNSPLPSPPIGEEQGVMSIIPITVKSPSPLSDKRDMSLITAKEEAVEEQPKLPKKKRATRMSVSTPKSCDENMSSFDSFLPLATPKTITVVVPAKTCSPDTSEAHTWDNLDKSLNMSQPLKTPLAQFKSFSVPTSTFLEEENENVYEFDSLSKPPVIPQKSDFPSAKKRVPSSHSMAERSRSISTINSSLKSRTSSLLGKPEPPVPQEGEDIYSFDSLEPSAKSGEGGREQQHKYDNKEIYSFDYLHARLQTGIDAETGGGPKGNLSPETGQPRKLDVTQGLLIQSSAHPNKVPPTLEDRGAGGALERPSVPALPPKSSPPMLLKQTQGASTYSSPEAAAPPVPVKKRIGSKSSVSYDTGEVTDATDVRAQIFPRNRSYLVDRTPDAMLPVTSNFSPSHSPPLPSRPSGPSLPPKPSNPLMSAKSKPNSDSKPPLPSKLVGRQWR